MRAVDLKGEQAMIVSALPTRKYFRKEAVVVKFPGQACPVQVERLGIPMGIPMKTAPGEFQPFRLVINLVMVDAAQPGNQVDVFDPPIEVRIRYTADDLAQAKEAGRTLSLGFWDGTQWIRFTPEKHQFRLKALSTPDAGGWGIVNISHWGDPTHAWGM